MRRNAPLNDHSLHNVFKEIRYHRTSNHKYEIHIARERLSLRIVRLMKDKAGHGKEELSVLWAVNCNEAIDATFSGKNFKI